MRRKSSWILAILVLVSSIGINACQTSPGPKIEITEAWARPSPSSADLGVIYMNISNTGSQDDRLVSATSSACAMLEIHETVMQGDVMQMRPVAEISIVIPAGETVVFKTGGLHLMCIDKQQDFALGAVISLALQFEVSGQVDLQVEVKNPLNREG